MIIKKVSKHNIKRDEWAERTPESEDERIGVTQALNRDVKDMESGKTRSRRYTLSEFEDKFF
jgi:hypothetical protein